MTVFFSHHNTILIVWSKSKLVLIVGWWVFLLWSRNCLWRKVYFQVMVKWIWHLKQSKYKGLKWILWISLTSFFFLMLLSKKRFKVKSITFNILRTSNGRLNNSNLLFLCFCSAREYIFWSGKIQGNLKMLSFAIVHFTVVCLVAKPLNRSEAKGDLVMIQTLLLFKCKLLCYHVN